MGEGGGGNKNAFLGAFKQRLTDSCMQDWNITLAESSRINLYSLFSKFDYQSYLEVINVKKFKVAMTKLKGCITSIRN